MLLWIVFTLVFCTYVALTLRKWRIEKYLGHLPTYPYLPLVGNMHLLIGGGEIISDPEEAKIVSNTFVEKPYYYKFARAWLGDGLVTAPGDVWKRNIKKIAGAFTKNVVNGYQDMFNSQARRLVDRIKLHVGSAPFDVMEDLTHTTLETICRTALGIPEISNSIVTEEYYRAFGKTLEILIKRGLNVFYHSEYIYRCTAAYKEMHENIAVLHHVSDTVIRNRKRDREIRKNIQPPDESKESSPPTFKSFLDLLLDLSEKDASLSEQQIKAEVNTIIVGGQETVATTLLFTLLIIGTRQDIQEELYKEVRGLFGESKRDVTTADLDRMVYCESLIYETLRLYPPVPAVLRQADRDLQLRSCTIPKGVTCIINAFGGGRSRRVWGEDALEYRPQRWTTAATSTILAFSVGKRACIGKRYAMAIVKTILAHCVLELVFKSEADKMKLKVDVAMKPCSGNLMQVQLRDRQSNVSHTQGPV